MTLVQDVMTHKTVSVRESASIDVAIDLMVEQNVSGIPVVDENQVLAGLITEYDVLQLYGSLQSDSSRYGCCADFMTREVRTIQENASLEVAAKIFQAASLRRLLVLDGDQFVGILSRRDIVRSIRDGRLRLASK